MAKQKPRPELAQSELIEELPAACASEAAAVDFLERRRFADGEYCPHCGAVGCVYKMLGRDGQRNKRFLWRCRDCSKMFTVRTGTVYAESLIPLHKWCHALWATASAKNGVSALELSRRIQVTYKTALFIMHRIRHATAHDPDTDPKLTGTVEADETYVGGKPRRQQMTGKPIDLPPMKDGKPPKFRNSHLSGRSLANKVPVFAVVQRGGEVRTRVIANVTAENIRQALTDHTEPAQSVLMTDDFASYRRVGGPFTRHGIIRHTIREYVRGDVHTNTIEGFFSRVKRKLNGTHHAVSKEHLHRYMSEAAFIYNTRAMNDGERTLALLNRTIGKRLMYRDPVGPAPEPPKPGEQLPPFPKSA